MLRKIIPAITLSLLPLIAQENFLKGVKAQDLSLDRIEAVPVEVAQDIDNKKDYWYIPPVYSITAYSLDSTMMAEVLFTEGKVTGLKIRDLITNTEKLNLEGIFADLKWSPGGKYLSFIKLEYVATPGDDKFPRKPFFNSERLCIYNNQTGEIDSIAFMKGIAMVHSWSPLNNYLAYSYVDKGQYILAIYNADNNKSTIIDEMIGCDLWNFSWSPNGRMLAYTKPFKMDMNIDEEVPLESEVFVVNYDGSGKTQITASPESELFVKWLPEGKQIITEMIKDPEKGYKPDYYYLILKKK